MTVMDSDRRLRCLSLNSILRFATMSFSSSSSQVMRSTTNSTPVSSLVLAVDRSTLMFDSMLVVKKDEGGEENKVEGEDGEADGSVLALWTGWMTCPFFFLVGGWTLELETEELVGGAYLSIPFWFFFSLFALNGLGVLVNLLRKRPH